MSEEILEKSAEQGAFASGGIGGVSDPASGILGNVPTANMGVTTGPNAVNPTGVAGGILAPEQSRRFIDYVWDATVLANDGRKVTMRANTQEIEKVNVGERVIRAANQADGTYTNAGATFTKVELTTTKIRLDWEISTESLEDNIEGSALEDHLVRLMTNAFANDLEDLAINGDGSTGNFLSILDEGRVAIAALATGAAEGCLDAALDYAQSRQVFGERLGSRQSIQFMIARMQARVHTARLAWLHAARLRDEGRPFGPEAAIAKLTASDAAMDNARDATQIFGGNGFMNEYPVARHFRDSKILEIGEGTTEVQLLVLARALGLTGDRAA